MDGMGPGRQPLVVVVEALLQRGVGMLVREVLVVAGRQEHHNNHLKGLDGSPHLPYIKDKRK